MVGIVANPASGRDIRRLVAGASVFGNPEKAGMVFRVLAGLAAAGVERALMMPAGDGLSVTLHRMFTAHRDTPLPEFAEVDMPLTGTALDSTRAVEAMLAAGVRAIVVLGGDGTHRVVAKACGDVPICALSTGTNNAFPEMREATVAGLAAGLVATGQASGVRRELALEVEVDGVRDLALVDLAVSRERFVGARALWRAESISELFVTHARPSAVGLSAIAGMLAPGAEGLHVVLGEGRSVRVPLAPGLIASIGVASFRRLKLDQPVTVPAGPGCLALDGEREIERGAGAPATVRLIAGPSRIEVDTVMAQFATHTSHVEE